MRDLTGASGERCDGVVTEELSRTGIPVLNVEFTGQLSPRVSSRIVGVLYFETGVAVVATRYEKTWHVRSSERLPYVKANAIRELAGSVICVATVPGSTLVPLEGCDRWEVGTLEALRFLVSILRMIHGPLSWRVPDASELLAMHILDRQVYR